MYNVGGTILENTKVYNLWKIHGYNKDKIN